MVTQIPPSPRSPRVRAPTRIQNRHLSSCPRVHPLCPTIPHVPSDHSTRLVLPNSLPITLPLLENPPTLPHLANPPATPFLTPSPSPFLTPSPRPFLTPFLTPFLESRPNLATRVVPPRLRAPYIHLTTTVRSRGVGPTTTMLPLLHPTTRNPNNPPPRPPFSTIPRQVYPELTPVLRVSSPPRSRPNKLPSSSPAFLRRVRLMRLLLRDLQLTAGRLL